MKSTQYEDMLSRLYILVLLFALSACSLFQNQNIQDKKIEDLLSSLQGTGEGKGRLGINRQQYLFSFDALLKENNDWLLAANIPLHGEEILVLPNLSSENELGSGHNDLGLRIEEGIRSYLKSQKQSPALAKTFLLELRTIMRLVLHKKLHLEIICAQKVCSLGDAVYQVEATSKQLSLKKSLSDEYEFEFAAMNLTNSIFRRSSIFLHSKNKQSAPSTLLSLELFWN
jgi:hypothetical protein